MLDQHRDWFKKQELFVGGLFSKASLTPDQYTIGSILFAIAGFFMLVGLSYIWALLLFVIAASLDFIDGAVARAKGIASKRGAYLDTIADRYVEALMLFGLLFAPLADLIFPSCTWIFLALFGTTMTTYAKAAAKEKGLSDTELKGGLMSRGERLILYFALLASLNFSLLIPAYILAAIALLSNFTALQRMNKALSR